MLFGLLVIGMLGSSVLMAETIYYVQSANAKILSAPLFKSDVIAEVRRGIKLNGVGKEGSWIKVNLDGKSGYVPSLLLANHPPLQRVDVVSAEGPEIKEGVRRRTSSFSSAAAARGLTKEGRQRADVEEGVDNLAVRKMEALNIGDDEVMRFASGEQP